MIVVCRRLVTSSPHHSGRLSQKSEVAVWHSERWVFCLMSIDGKPKGCVMKAKLFRL